MIVAQLIEKLLEVPQHLSVIVDVSRPTDPDFVFTIPEMVEVVQDPAGQDLVFIGSYSFEETDGLN